MKPLLDEYLFYTGPRGDKEVPYDMKVGLRQLDEARTKVVQTLAWLCEPLFCWTYHEDRTEDDDIGITVQLHIPLEEKIHVMASTFMVFPSGTDHVVFDMFGHRPKHKSAEFYEMAHAMFHVLVAEVCNEYINFVHQLMVDPDAREKKLKEIKENAVSRVLEGKN